VVSLKLPDPIGNQAPDPNDMSPGRFVGNDSVDSVDGGHGDFLYPICSMNIYIYYIWNIYGIIYIYILYYIYI
jgi:hypothetical protein